MILKLYYLIEPCRFMVMMTAKMGGKDSRDDILKAFRVFDSDESGALIAADRL